MHSRFQPGVMASDTEASVFQVRSLMKLMAEGTLAGGAEARRAQAQ